MNKIYRSGRAELILLYGRRGVGKTRLIKEFLKNKKGYVGFVFEEISKQFIIKNRDYIPFKFTKIGKWWHKDKEIDLVALGEQEVLFVECKWKDLKEREARKILQGLKEKAEYGPCGGRKYFGIIAKKIENKPKFRQEGFLAFDLRDFR